MSEPTTLEGGMFALDPDDDRVVRGLLLPYGVPCSRPMAGEAGTMFAAGDVEIPNDPSVATLNRQHNRFDPVGRAVELVDTARGVLAAFRFAETPEGDAELADYRDGKRKPLSAELATYRDAAGAVVRRVLVGAGIVDRGAFAGAALYAEVDPEETPTDEPQLVAAARAVIAAHEAGSIPQTAAAPVPGQAGAAADPEDPDPAAHAADPADTDPPAPADEAAPGAVPETTEGETPMTETASAPSTLGTSEPAPDATTTPTAGDLFAAIVEARRTGGPIPAEFRPGGELFALGAATGQLGTVMAPQFIGQVWEGGNYRQKWLPLFSTGDLTSLVVTGWRSVSRPTVAAYAGDGAPVGGSAFTTEPVTENAQRFAGGNTLPREYYDFNQTEFVEAWARFARDDYARKADGYVRTKALAAATPVVSTVPGGGEPSLPVIRRIVDGIFAIGEDPINARASFAVIPTEDYKLLMHTGHSDLLEYLALALGVESGSVLGFRLDWDSSLAAGTAVVGARESAKVRQLPGSPIRINAANVAAGSFDEALFGYVHFMDELPEALVIVDDTP